MPERTVDVRVILRWPVGPVRGVVGNAMQELIGWNLNHIGPPDRHGFVEQVNDAGIAVQRLLRTDSARWSDVSEVMDESGLVIVTLRSGRRFSTHISRRSIDLLGRSEAYDMAKLSLQRWGEHR